MPRKEKKYHYLYMTTNLINKKFYVGMHSTNNLEDGYLGSGTYLRRSINKHGKENFKLDILDFFLSREILIEKEKEFVDKDFIKNPMCMNLMTGGSYLGLSDEALLKLSEASKGRILSEEHKLKISSSLKKSYEIKPRSEEVYKKIGLANKGKIVSEESRKRISEAAKGNTSHKGFKHSEESKLLMSKKKLGKITSEETRLKLSNAFKGKKHSEETINRLSEINKGKILTEEHRLKLSNSHKGKTTSEETKRKMSEAQLRRRNKSL